MKHILGLLLIATVLYNPFIIYLAADDSDKEPEEEHPGTQDSGTYTQLQVREDGFYYV